MNIAVDRQVSNIAIEYLENIGHYVVYCANHEPDNIWFDSALYKGADLFISPDWDISFLCNKHNKKFIRLKQGLKGIDIGKFIAKKINKHKYD